MDSVSEEEPIAGPDQAYTEKLTRNALLSAEVTGTEGSFLTEGSRSFERSVDRFTTSSGSLNVSLRGDALAGYDVVSL